MNTPNPEKRTVLIIENDKRILDLYTQFLFSMGFIVIATLSFNSAQKILDQHHSIIDVVLSDNNQLKELSSSYSIPCCLMGEKNQMDVTKMKPADLFNVVNLLTYLICIFGRNLR